MTYPDTQVRELAETDRGYVLACYRGCGDMTADECAEKLGWKDVYKARRRVTELKKAGELEETGEQRETTRGRFAAVLRVPQSAHQGELF